MSKVWDKPITADTDWGGDASTDNLPVSGRQVQAWIKGNIKNDDAISLLIAKWLNEHTTNSITFWKGLPIDSGTLKWVDEHLTVIGGTGSSETPQDLPFIYDPVKKAWEFKGDFVVTGAITMFGSLSGFQPSTVTEAVEVDGETIIKTKNSQGQWQLTAIGGGSGTGGGISAAEVNILISNALEPYALSTSIPTDNKQLLNGAGYATVGDLDTRINNLINGAPAAYDTLKEIADVLAGNVNSIGDILTALDTKATKTYVDGELAKYILKDTAQDISARHNFVDGLQIGGLPITKSASANNTIYLDANLVVSGAITMFGTGSTTFPTIWANIPFDLNTMEWTGSVWRVKDGGSGSLDTNAVNALISKYLRQGSYATISDISSALVGYATQGWVGDNYLSKSGGSINGSLSLSEYLHINSWSGYGSGSASFWYDGNNSTLNITADTIRLNDNPVIHSGNYSDYALPITGGTVNGSITANSFKGSFFGQLLPSITALDCNNVGSTHGWVNPSSGFTNTPFAGELVSFDAGEGLNALQFLTRYDIAVLYVRHRLHINNNWSSWREVAFIDSTVEAANRLAAPRTIWGQSFDGTENITHGFRSLYADSYNGGVAHSILNNQGSPYGLLTRIFGNGSVSLQAQREANDAECFNLLLNHLGGNIAIGGTEAIEKLTVHGNLLTTGVVTMFSQASMKNVIDYDGLSLAQLAQIKPARFTWKDSRDSLVHAGGIADEVMRVLPEVVHRTKDDKLTMDYGSAGFFMAASLIKHVIDHEQRLQSAEKEIKDLRAKNKRLREQLRVV